MTISRNDVIKFLQEQVKEGEYAAAALALLQPPTKPGMLSPHFSLAEMTYSATAAQYGLDNTPDAQSGDRLKELCVATLEGIRSLCGNNPVQITSGFRSKEVNQRVGGASNSAHLYGCAADLVIPAFGSPREICKMIEPKLRDLGIDQLIYENQSWVHVGRAIPPSTTPRYQVLTINGGSTVQGIA